MAHFIDDGYTRSVTLPACEWHGEFSFSYRPMTRRERMRHFKSMEGKDPFKAEDIADKLLSERIVEWDGPDPTPDNIARMEPHLNGSVYKIVIGLEAPPGEESDQDTEDADQGN